MLSSFVIGIFHEGTIRVMLKTRLHTLSGDQHRIPRKCRNRMGEVGRGVRAHRRDYRRARLRPDVLPQSLQRRLLPHSTQLRGGTGGGPGLIIKLVLVEGPRIKENIMFS